MQRLRLRSVSLDWFWLRSTECLPLNCGELFLGFELVFGHPVVGLDFVGFFSGLAIGLVDCAGRELDPAFNIALCGLLCGRHGELHGLLLVNFVVLCEALVATAVEDIIPGASTIRTSEDLPSGRWKVVLLLEIVHREDSEIGDIIPSRLMSP